MHRLQEIYSNMKCINYNTYRTGEQALKFFCQKILPEISVSHDRLKFRVVIKAPILKVNPSSSGTSASQSEQEK